MCEWISVRMLTRSVESMIDYTSPKFCSYFRCLGVGTRTLYASAAKMCIRFSTCSVHVFPMTYTITDLYVDTYESARSSKHPFLQAVQCHACIDTKWSHVRATYPNIDSRTHIRMHCFIHVVIHVWQHECIIWAFAHVYRYRWSSGWRSAKSHQSHQAFALF